MENNDIVEKARATVQADMPGTVRGTVVRFNDESGYGFIQCADVDKDVFVHHRNIIMKGHRTLRQGMTVSFRLTQGPKGWNAEEVVPC